MTINLDLQNVSSFQEVPEVYLFKTWVLTALKDWSAQEAEITLRIVDTTEMKKLNARFRGQNKATNVLSFVLETSPLVGDIVLCAPIIAEEAQLQKKAMNSHWAHLTVHGILHLIGYDHIAPDEAMYMESLEVNILKNLGFPNPYEE